MNKEKQQILQQEVERGEQAKRAMEHFIGPFFEDKISQLFAQMEHISIGDADTLVALHHQIKSLNALHGHIKTYIETGKMAQISLNELRKPR